MSSPAGLMSIFDVIGPVMIGPSSSHTAGALRIGQSVFRLLDSRPKKIRIVFYNSFADTMDGHGTKKAVIGGLLGFETSDPRIKKSEQIAHGQGMAVLLEKKYDEEMHPNSVKITVETEKGNFFSGFGESIGGGSIVFRQIALEGEALARTV